MKSTELRISNLVCHKHLKGNILYDYDTITSVSENGITLKSRPFTSITLDSIKPIPLTEEWLLRLGFEKITKGKLIRYKQNGVTLGCEDDHWTNPRYRCLQRRCLLNLY